MASRKRSISDDTDVPALYKELDEASCPICMDHPHNAVLLICSSHDKGCRSYICDTSYRHSNCLDRFKKLKEENADSLSAPTNDSVDISTPNLDTTSIGFTIDHAGDTMTEGTNSAAHVAVPGGSGESGTHDANPDLEEQEMMSWGSLDNGETNMEKSDEGSNLRCPLCRGSVLGWKVTEQARKYLNLKSRSCSRESCSFSGSYRELRRHARRVHPTVRPGDVDPSRQRAWRRLEDQREYNDIVSAIHSAIPGAIVLGDYVIENGDRLSGERDNRVGGAGGRLLSTFFLFQMIGSMEAGSGGRARVLPRHRRANATFARRRYLWGENLLGLQDDEDEDEEDEEDEPEVNIVSDLGDDVPANPRRRRRLTRARSDEDQQ
ncbi:hypothetical protein BUALT_Bualt02G0194700 [Buddleja alternifolia]|uniref:Uncharacterized protein n=1 Tax=Buddleja alternifolia TaxID=168488 RepID=A0AAV6Y5S9_9LAMI|nr:hypothetical protein BUALT_Bualt02G0194700 [Buddleja alternifolia]